MEGKKSFGSAKKRLEVLMSSCAVETIKPPPSRPCLNFVITEIRENMLLV